MFFLLWNAPQKLFFLTERNHATTAQKKNFSFTLIWCIVFLFLCSDDSIIHKLNHTQNGHQLLFDTKRSNFNWLQWHHVQFHTLSSVVLSTFGTFHSFFPVRITVKVLKNEKSPNKLSHNFYFDLKILSPCGRNINWPRYELIDDNNWIFRLNRAILKKSTMKCHRRLGRMLNISFPFCCRRKKVRSRWISSK